MTGKALQDLSAVNKKDGKMKRLRAVLAAVILTLCCSKHSEKPAS